MCGIAGIVNLAPDGSPIDVALLRPMAAELVHRGPDDEGFYVDPRGRCGLGFRRLSIIDVAGGHQPLSNEDGTVWIVLNGEIYNFGDLRAELEQRGHVFKTRTDTEVIVHLYEEHGEGCCTRLHGMFALALWDQTRGRLLLARDRFGKKPLHYAVHAGRLCFGSELKAILAVAGMPREIDAQALHRYLLFQYVPAPHSIYCGFRKVPPGTYVQVEGGAAREPRPYWQVPRPARFGGSYEDAKRRLGELLTEAVRKRLVADVPLGAFLSGGVDSSIVVALMRELGVSPLRTFSIGFADARYDETAYARQVAARYQTEHHEHVVTPQARALLDTLAWHYDEPFADSSAIPTYYVARWTREHVTVALTGDAGDECFAGYDRYRAAALAARVDFVPRPLRAALAAVARLVPHGRAKTVGTRLYRLGSALAERGAGRYLAWVSVFPPEMLADGYREEFRRQIDFGEPLAWFAGLHDGAPGPVANQAVHTDFASYLPYDLLTKVDVASMACGLECRAPFLDHELVEFALSLPTEWRLGRAGGKRILKEWARGRVPEAVLDRPKMGFGVPVGEWFRRELADLVRDRVLDPGGLPAQVFRSEWLQRVVGEHLSGHVNHEHRLWGLLMLALWRDRWRPIGPAV